jgi:hypothetical protein
MNVISLLLTSECGLKLNSLCYTVLHLVEHVAGNGDKNGLAVIVEEYKHLVGKLLDK